MVPGSGETPAPLRNTGSGSGSMTGGDYPMKKNGTRRHGPVKRLLCLFLCALAAAACGSAGATPHGWDIADMILATDTAQRLDLRAPDGSTLQLRSNPALEGRGKADAGGKEPDYIGMVGFAVVPPDPDLSKFSSLNRAYWWVPMYKRNRDGSISQAGSYIAHKTPVIVTNQELEEDGEGGYRGYLEIIRLDMQLSCILDVSCFVTHSYWDLPVTESSAYGFGIAVYRESPGEGPRDEDGNAVPLRDGARVLIPCEGCCADSSPKPEVLNVQGVIYYKDENGKPAARVVYFRDSDLIQIY